MGATRDSSGLLIIRKRFPSLATAYCRLELNCVTSMVVRNSARGAPASNARALSMVTASSVPSGDR